MFSMGLTAATNNALEINGIPVKITVYDDSTMHVENSVCGGHQYNLDSKGSILLVYKDENDVYGWGGGSGTCVLYNNAGRLQFTPVSNAYVDPQDPFAISTVYLAGLTNDIQVTQTVSYTNGSPFYKIVWEVVNTGVETYTGLRFRHGGDTNFWGDNTSVGNWDPVMRKVFVTKSDPNLDGEYMALYGATDEYGDTPCPADNFAEFFPANVESYMKSRHPLNGFWRDVDHDAAYALEWLKDDLAPGDSWTVTAYERWNCGPNIGGRPEVIATEHEGCSETINVNFEVINWGLTPDIYDLEVTSQNGWTYALQGPNPITIDPGPGASAAVTVELTVPFVNTDDVLTLTATSQFNPLNTHSAGADIINTCGCFAGNKVLIDAVLDTETGLPGDRFNLGDTMTIQWNTDNVPPEWQDGRLRLTLWKRVNGVYTKVGRIGPLYLDEQSVLAKEYDWVINEVFERHTNSMIPVPPGENIEYIIKIGETDRGCYDFYDSAIAIAICWTGEKVQVDEVLDATGQPSVDFNVGDEMTITWNTDNIPAEWQGRPLRLTLWRYENGAFSKVGRIGPLYLEEPDVSNKSYTWVIDQVFERHTNSMIDVETGYNYLIKIGETARGCYDFSHRSDPFITIIRN
jgi:hypothetical protein